VLHKEQESTSYHFKNLTDLSVFVSAGDVRYRVEAGQQLEYNIPIVVTDYEDHAPDGNYKLENTFVILISL